MGLAGTGPRSFRIASNPRDHRHEAVGALRSQMLVEMQLAQYRDRVDIQNFVCRLAGIDGEKNSDLPADDMRVAVADEGETRDTVGMDRGREPHLADAALDLRFRGP